MARGKAGNGGKRSGVGAKTRQRGGVRAGGTMVDRKKWAAREEAQGSLLRDCCAGCVRCDVMVDPERRERAAVLGFLLA